VVNGNSPFNSISDFIEAAKKNPGSINYASAGVGSSPHLAGELFKMMAKVDMTHIAYKGTNPALTDLLGGQVQAFFGPVPAVIQHIQSGKLKALGVTTPERFNAIKQVPPIASVVPGYSVLQWWGFVTPAGTPKIVIDKINKDVADILKSPEMMDRLAKMGAEPGGQSPAYLDKIISEDVIKYGAVVKATNLKAE
jgi:tripartite-type tricarboxylate transporter receptor subunit TctC